MTESVNKESADNTVCGRQTHSFTEGQVSLRRFPYPYKAAMAICSDIDETKTTEEFLEIQPILEYKAHDKHG